MVLEKVSFGNCLIFALALAEVTSWTVDLPEVRKFFFEKNEREKEYEDFQYKNEEIAKQPVYYNNIEGNSKHNSKNYDDVYENTDYAKEYGYQSYMEKKVQNIVYNSSAYLEGLRRSLENYTRLLENCNRSSRNQGSNTNSTTWRPNVELSSFNSTNVDNSTTIPRISNSTSMRDDVNSTEARCREATKYSEHVRRLSELAAWATRELQDVAYARKYKKDDEHELMMQENELILKLAWFLDRLAHYTGFEPEPKDYFDKNDNRTTTTTTPAPISLMNPSEETKRLMMECLQQNSSEPAVDRCRYEEPLPSIVQMMMEMNSNISGISAMPTSSSNRFEQVVPLRENPQQTPVSEQSMELLVASDNRRPTATYPQYADFPPFLTAVRNVRKRSILSMPGPEARENAPKIKRLIENDPAIHFLKYYAKHKIWEGSNLKSVNVRKNEEYEVINSLTHQLQRRAIDNKKLRHLKLPENPFQDLSKYVKHRPGVNYIKDEAQAQKIKAALEKIDNIKPEKSYKNALRKIDKLFRQKRYVKFEKDVDLPRDSEDPQGDISYYTKNKPGRNYNSNLVQAAQVRAGIEQIANTGNIEVVRRFGANYNPLIPAPFFAGVIKSQADF